MYYTSKQRKKFVFIISDRGAVRSDHICRVDLGMLGLVRSKQLLRKKSSLICFYMKAQHRYYLFQDKVTKIDSPEGGTIYFDNRD